MLKASYEWARNKIGKIVLGTSPLNPSDSTKSRVKQENGANSSKITQISTTHTKRDKKSIRKYSEQDMQNALKQLNQGGDKISVNKASTDNGIPHKTLNRYWNEIKNLSHVQRQKEIKNFELKNIGNENFSRYLTDGQERILVNFIKVMDKAGTPLEREDIKSFALVLARQNDHPHAQCSDKWFREFLKRHESELGEYRTSNIEIKRVKACTIEVRNKFFHNMVEFHKRLVDEKVFKTINDILAHHLFNYDEKKESTIGKRNKKLGDKTNTYHCDITGTDNEAFHVTNGMTCCADGVTFIPPAIIHSSPGTKSGNSCNISTKLVEGLDPDMMVYVTKNGSATKDFFLAYCYHFVKNLPDKYGVGKEPAILYLDGHSRLWNPEALKYMKANNVHVFCLAAHTSAIAQPNDCGSNAAFKAIMSKLLKEWRCNNRLCIITRNEMNKLITLGWTQFKAKMLEQKLKGNSNTMSRSFVKTGIFPLNPNNAN